MADEVLPTNRKACMKFVVKLRSSKRTNSNNDEVVTATACGGQRKRKSRSQEMKEYRARLKENPESYKLQLELDRQRAYEYRRKLSADKKKLANEKARSRMRRMRERRRNEVNANPAPETVHTRSAGQKQKKRREYWKRKKREERAKMSAQKKRRVREKDAQRKRASRAIKAGREDPFGTPAARRKAISRAKTRMPKSSASKYADVVKGLITTATPEQVIELEKHGIMNNVGVGNDVFAALRRTYGTLATERKRYFVSKMTRQLDAKHGLKCATSRYLGIRWRYLMRYARLSRSGTNVEKRKRRSDAISQTMANAVAEHYRKPHVSTLMPNRKLADGETPTHVLQKSLAQTHKDFCAENTGMDISLSKFVDLRPRNILVQSKAKLFQCLCEYCTNVELAVKVLNQEVMSAHVNNCTIRDKYHASDITLCHGQSGGEASESLLCIDRQCGECGVSKLDAHLAPLLTKANEKVLTWQQWGTTDVEGRKRVTLKRQTGTVHDLVNNLKSLLTPFSCHLFQAKWQQSQFYAISRNPPADTVVTVMDFAENYSCITQNEVQGAHWHNVQVTVHPMVSYYQCHNECGNPSPVRESIDVVSDDLRHDAHAVQCFVGVAIDHLQEVRHLYPKRLIQFSDGCSAQYKSKTPLMDLSCASADYSIATVERHYFGSRHGKNPCDGEGGVLKNCVARAVRSEPEVSVNDAQSFFDFCTQRLVKKDFDEEGKCNHSRRVFYLVEKGTIDRNRQERSEVTTLPGTRKIHAAVGISQYRVKTKRLSCFCTACNDDNPEECRNTEYTGVWTEKTLRPRGPPGRREDPATAVDDEGLPDLGEVDQPLDLSDDPKSSEPATIEDLTGLGGDTAPQTRSEDELEHNVTGGVKLSADVGTDKEQTGMELLRSMISDQCGPMDLPEGHSKKHSSLVSRVPVEKDKYYAVFYDNEPYIGRALREVSEGEWEFKFLHRVRTAGGQLYDWPCRDDIDTALQRYIFHGPVNLIGSGPFQVAEIETMEEAFHSIKQTSVRKEQ